MYRFDDSEITQVIRDTPVPDLSKIDQIVAKASKKNGGQTQPV